MVTGVNKTVTPVIITYSSVVLYVSRGRTDKELTSTLVIRTFLSFELADIFLKYGSRLFFKKA